MYILRAYISLPVQLTLARLSTKSSERELGTLHPDEHSGNTQQLERCDHSPHCTSSKRKTAYKRVKNEEMHFQKHEQ
ncbi:hypothetical protein IscW_ISCW011153 [Ixodes scapularis]|uniref:Uncharacterized protein n=1 Tax=Ixodes scapularis TaxID=6945 RepID=B7Q801_IXOSC|nr:hypothetical protein IscW_ISCW011153 [Ixodes scapularis]|eukprot:XP_002412254.1 hypothetical protein IscW_ISCW011153 [Ixodes scapularis]